MAQYLKDEVQAAIAAAALREFAERGYAGATMAQIAKTAGVSTGNIYRYYESKEVLFDEVLSDDFARSYTDLLHARMESLDGVDDYRRLGPAAAFHFASEELLRFSIEHRLSLVVLLGRAQGSRLESFGEELVADLSQRAIAHFRRMRPDTKVSEAMGFTLARIYRNLIATTVDALASFEDEAQIREVFVQFTKYHLAGLASFFE